VAGGRLTPQYDWLLDERRAAGSHHLQMGTTLSVQTVELYTSRHETFILGWCTAEMRLNFKT
jgi:hypothetical protein